ncbi:MAG: hypothetical protein N3F05_01225 [Candidatus Diapherotrites archaeon]|nr:hypothetical protein [Candidatus Diapherotrites archaeon]
MFFKPRVALPSGQARVLLLFSNSLSSSLYVISEIEKNSAMKGLFSIVGSATDNVRATGIKTIDMKNIYYRSFDRKLFTSKKGGSKENCDAEFVAKIKELTAEFKPNIIILDNFATDGGSIENIFKMPVLDSMVVCIEGVKVTTFSGENAIRNAILNDKRELRAGVFLYINGSKHLFVLSKKFQIDLQKLGAISISDDFERFIRLSNEKYIWNCSGPALLKALELVASCKAEEKGGRLYIKEGGSSIQGFYNMITECAQGICGIENLG